jgi:hypothetical protein
LVRDHYGNASGNDSGYIQSYYALGLVVSVLFYGFLAGHLSGYLKASRGKGMHVLLVALMFVIEAKEPFIFKYGMPFFCLAAVYLLAAREAGIDGRGAGA